MLADIRRLASVGLMLGQRLRRWHNINPTLAQCFRIITRVHVNFVTAPAVVLSTPRVSTSTTRSDSNTEKLTLPLTIAYFP